MRFLCPFCNSAITADDSARGFRVQCSGCGKSILVPTDRFETGCVIGDFAIRSKLGAGAIGTVYKAYQISLERIVALKILSKKYMTIRGVEEFMREARSAANLSHPNLVQSYAVGEEQGICYMAMVYINGETLKSRIRREGAIPCDEALHIIQQVAEALHYVWTESGLVHRDVKPDNIMLAEHGIVKLTDLGLAIKQTDWHENMDISGSPSYMSPEQFAGEKLDTRSDIYSLGVTLYQMLTGELPYDADTIGSIAKQHFEDAIPNVSKIMPGIPASVNNLIKKMLAKHRNKRFQDMDALLKEIWKIRQVTAPDKNAVPDVHTISMRRLDYEIQNIYRDKTEDILIPPPRNNGKLHFAWLLICLLVAIGGLTFTSAFYLKYRTADDTLKKLVVFQNQEKDILNFATLASEMERNDSELETEYARIMKKMRDLYGDPVRKQLMTEYLKDIMELRSLRQDVAELKQEKNSFDEALALAEEKARSVNAQSEEIWIRQIDDLRTEYERKMLELEREIGTLQTANADFEKRQKAFLEQIRLLETEIAKRDQDMIAARQEMEKSKTLRKEFQDLIKIQLAESVCEHLRYRRFTAAEEKIAAASAKFTELTDWLNGVLALVHDCKKVHNFFQNDPEGSFNGKTFAGGARVIDSVSGGTITYHLQENPAISLKCNMTELTHDALLDLMKITPADSPDARRTLAAFELMRGNFGTAVTLYSENPILAETADIYAVRTADRIINLYPSETSRKSYENFKKRFSGVQSYTKLEEKLKILFKEKSSE